MESTEITSYLEEGLAAVWGAGAKGVTFVNLFDPDRQKISSNARFLSRNDQSGGTIYLSAIMGKQRTDHLY